MSVKLAVIEYVIAASGIATAIEALLPGGVRARQLPSGTLLTGMMLALADGRLAHLTRVLEALTGLHESDQTRLSVIAQWKSGPHQLTYRQIEHAHRLITRALAKTEPAGGPSAGLQKLCGQLLEASIPATALCRVRDGEANPEYCCRVARDWRAGVARAVNTNQVVRRHARDFHNGPLQVGYVPPFGCRCSGSRGLGS